MTPNELRALADCLDDPNAMQRTARRKAADYLRACADAKPVATLTLLDDMGVQIDFRKSFTLLPGQTFFLYTHPAPATPQAEPKREDRPVRDLLAIIHCDGGHHTEAVGLDQSIKDAQAAVCELKRKLAMEERVPLSDDEILDIATAAGLRFSMYSDDVETRAAIKRLARAVERAHGIGGSDAE